MSELIQADEVDEIIETFDQLRARLLEALVASQKCEMPDNDWDDETAELLAQADALLPPEPRR